MSFEMFTDYREVVNSMRFEFLKNWKSKRMFSVLSISILLSSLFALIPLLTGSDFPEDSYSYITNVMNFTSLAYILFALFFGSDSINRESYEGTDLLLYPLPQKRVNIIIGKFLTQLLSSWLAIVVYYAVVATSVFLIYGSDAIPPEMVTSLLYSFIFMSAVLTFAFLLSSVMNSPASSMTLTFFGLQILLPLLIFLLGLADIDVDWIFTNYSSLISATMGLSGGGFGPNSDASTPDFFEGVQNVMIQGGLLFLLSLYFGTKKEVGS